MTDTIRAAHREWDGSEPVRNLYWDRAAKSISRRVVNPSGS